MKSFNPEKNYSTSSQLKMRKKFNALAHPKVNLDREILAQSNLLGNEAILDIGCGYGDLLKLIRSSGYQGKLYGIDSSAGMIAEATKDNAKSITFRVSKAEKLPFPKNAFDAIICKHALYHFDIPKAIEEMRRVLKPGGKLIISLNSRAHSSRDHIETYKKFLARKLKADYVHTSAHANFENYEKYLDNFLLLRQTILCRYARITDSQIFLEYMNSFHEVFDPIPSVEAWDLALKKLKVAMDAEIRQKGRIVENLFVGIGVWEKPKK